MEYDWFVRSCDDTYFIVNNLRRFLVDKNPDMPHFFGMIVPVRFTPTLRR
jgi:glycoprotein-N-acetylgalactosamine 3-beta-galactosyltransferase